MAISLGDFITAAEAKAIADTVDQVELIKQQLQANIKNDASGGLTEGVYLIPTSIANGAKTLLEGEGYTCSTQAAGNELSQITINWANPT